MVNVPAILSASNFPSCLIQSRAPSPRRVSSSLQKFLSPAAVPHSTSVVSLRVREGRRQGLNVEGQACHGTKVWAGGKRARELNVWINVPCAVAIELFVRSTQIQVLFRCATYHC